MAGTSLILTYHADNVEIHAWIYLIIGLTLCRLMYDTLTNISEGLSWDSVCDRAIAWWLLKTNGIVHAG